MQERIADYDRKILEKVEEMTRAERRGLQAPELKNKEKARSIQRRGEEPLRQALYPHIHLVETKSRHATLLRAPVERFACEICG